MSDRMNFNDETTAYTDGGAGESGYSDGNTEKQIGYVKKKGFTVHSESF